MAHAAAQSQVTELDHISPSEGDEVRGGKFYDFLFSVLGSITDFLPLDHGAGAFGSTSKSVPN